MLLLMMMMMSAFIPKWDRAVCAVLKAQAAMWSH